MTNVTRTREAAHRLTWVQVETFLAFNGLELGTHSTVCVAGDPGAPIGRVAAAAHGQVLLVVAEEELDVEGSVVKAWWPGFRPAWIIVGGNSAPDVGPCLGPDEVVCDLCNAAIVTRPVPVVGSYALCQACFLGTGLPFPGRIQPYVPQAFEHAEEGGSRC